MSNRRRRKRRRSNALPATRAAAITAPQASQSRTRELTCRAYHVRANTWDAEARSVEAVIATEEPVEVFDMRRWDVVLEVLVMDNVEFADQVPYLDTHDRSSVRSMLGSTRNLRVEDGQLLGTNIVAETEEGNRVASLIAGGHLRDNSIGYRVLEHVTIDAGETHTIDGRTWTAPPDRDLRVTTRWRVSENSACPIGADNNAKNRDRRDEVPRREQTTETTRTTPPHRKGTDMNEQLRHLLIEFGLDADAGDDDARAYLHALEGTRAEIAKNFIDANGLTADGRAAPVPETNPTGDENRNDPVDVQTAIREATEAEAARRRGIRKAIEGFDIARETVDGWLDDPSVTVEQARARVLEHLRTTERPADAGFAVHTVDRTASSAILEASLLERAGVTVESIPSSAPPRAAATMKRMLSNITDEARDKADRHFRDMSLVDLCRHALALQGESTRGSNEDVAKRAMSTVSLENVLSNVAHKAAMKGALDAPQTWRLWCSIGDLSDFKAHSLVRIIGGNRQAPIADNGDLALRTLSDTGQTNTADTYGGQLRITRKTIINDDRSLLSRVPMMEGRAMMQTVNIMAYETLTADLMSDGSTAIFDSDTNLHESAPLNIDNVNAAIAAMAKRKDGDSYRYLEPRVLIVPSDLHGEARAIVSSPSIVIGGVKNGQVTRPSNNFVSRDDLQVAADPVLSADSISTWYLAADPATCDNVRVGFLNGIQQPNIQRLDTPAGNLGMVFQIYMDFGVDAVDAAGLDKNTA